eukprot:jgi/Mesvir1/4993/Mv18035-RA.1
MALPVHARLVAHAPAYQHALVSAASSHLTLLVMHLQLEDRPPAEATRKVNAMVDEILRGKGKQAGGGARKDKSKNQNQTSSEVLVNAEDGSCQLAGSGMSGKSPAGDGPPGADASGQGGEVNAGKETVAAAGEMGAVAVGRAGGDGDSGMEVDAPNDSSFGGELGSIATMRADSAPSQATASNSSSTVDPPPSQALPAPSMAGEGPGIDPPRASLADADAGAATPDADAGGGREEVLPPATLAAAAAVLEECRAVFSQGGLLTGPDGLPLALEPRLCGLGSFGNQVLFLTLEDGAAKDRICEMASLARAHFKARGITREDEEEDEFKPHITVAKLSKMKPWQRKKQKLAFPQDLLDPATPDAGSVPVAYLDLCSMVAPKQVDGYYKVLASVPLLPVIN